MGPSSAVAQYGRKFRQVLSDRVHEGAVAVGVAHALLALCVVIFLVEQWELQSQLDDAYISYRVASNLSNGDGLVYNVGQHVEAFTNMLWVVLVSVGMVFGLDGPHAGHVLDLAGGTFAILVVYWYSSVGTARATRWLSAVASALLLTSIPFSLWSNAGMETVFFSAAITGALAAQAHGRMTVATGMAIVATATRPEGALVAGVIFLFHLSSSGIRNPKAWVHPLAYAVFLLLLEIFRLAYYGSPLPNTFYAKVGGVPLDHGRIYLWGFLENGPGLLLLPALVACALDRRAWPGGASLALLSLYVVLIGGDAFPQYRFLVPGLTALASLGMWGVAKIWSVNRLAGALTLLLVPATAYLQAWDPDRCMTLERIHGSWARYEGLGKRRATALNQASPKPKLVYCGATGAFGYYADFPVLDIYGLTDPDIARSGATDSRSHGLILPGHQRANASVVFAREPDYLFVRERNRGPRNPALIEIWQHPDLEAHYVWDRRLMGYARKKEDGSTQLRKDGRQG